MKNKPDPLPQAEMQIEPAVHKPRIWFDDSFNPPIHTNPESDVGKKRHVVSASGEHSENDTAEIIKTDIERLKSDIRKDFGLLKSQLIGLKPADLIKMEHQIKVPMHGKRVPIIPHYGLAGLPSRDPAADVNPNVHDPETLNTLTQILARHKALRIDGPKTERNLALVLLMLGSGYGATDLSIFAPAHLAARKIFQPSTFHAVSYARSRPRNSLIDVVADWLASSPPATKHTPYFAPLGARQIQRIIGATAAPYTGVHLKRIYRHIIEDPDAFLSSLQRAHLKILADDPRPRHLQQFPYTKHVRNYSSEKPINKALDSNLLTLHSVLND